MSSKPKSFYITVIPQIDKTTDLKYAPEEVKNIKTIQTPFTDKEQCIKQVHEILQENGKKYNFRSDIRGQKGYAVFRCSCCNKRVQTDFVKQFDEMK